MDDLHLDDSKPPKLYLPDGWPSDADELNLRATCDRLRTENALLRRELAIKDARMNRIPPKKRPNYTSGERLKSSCLRRRSG